MTNMELREYFADHDLRGLRKACGLSAVTVARALGITPPQLADLESRRKVAIRALGVRYARVVAGMERHLAVTWDEPGEAE